MINAPTFSIPVAKLINQQAEEYTLEKSKVEDQFNNLAELVDDKKIDKEDRIPTE